MVGHLRLFIPGGGRVVAQRQVEGVGDGPPAAAGIVQLLLHWDEIDVVIWIIFIQNFQQGAGRFCDGIVVFRIVHQHLVGLFRHHIREHNPVRSTYDTVIYSGRIHIDCTVHHLDEPFINGQGVHEPDTSTWEKASHVWP